MKSRLTQYIIIAIVISSVSIYLRCLPYTGPGAESPDTDVRNIVYNRIKTDLAQQIQRAQPDLSDDDKDQLLKVGFENLLWTEKAAIEKFINDNRDKLSPNETPQKKNKWHLMEADGYHYLGLTKNIYEKGSVSASIKGGLYYNPLMMAPRGHRYYFDLHPYVGFVVSKLIRVFYRGMPLEQAVAFTSLFLSLIAISVFLMLSYYCGIAPLPAMTGSFFFASAAIFFQRSLLGWYDTDPYNVIFPTLIILCAFLSFDVHRNRKRRLLGTLLAAITTGIYTMFWSGWVFWFISIGLAYICASVYRSLHNRDLATIKESLLHLIIYICLSALAILLLRGYQGLIYSFDDTYSRVATFINKDFNLWPDAFLTVGELKYTPLIKIVILSGGRIFWSLALIGLWRLTLNKDTDTSSMKTDRARGIFLITLLSIAFAISTRAERFTILLVAPLAVAFTISLNAFYDWALRSRIAITRYVATVFMLILMWVPFHYGYMMGTREQPIIYNDTWDAVMNKIRNQSDKDSIIDTWWSPGHFITAMAQRGVLFDGATLEMPAGYWISKVFLTDDEDYAKGILRMLNTSGNEACDLLTNKGFALSEAADIIDRIVVLPREQASGFLKRYLNTEETQALLSLTHAKPAPSYLFIYNELVEKNVILCFMGNWDFKKAEIFRELKRRNPKAAENLIRTEADNNYIRFLWSISEGPLYYDKESFEVSRSENMVYFSNGLYLDLETMVCDFSSKDNPNKGKIKSLFYAEGDKIREKAMLQEPSRLSVVLVDHGRFYSTVLCDIRMARSMLFRLYYLKGAGLKNFKPFIYEKDPDGPTAIWVYEID